MALKTVNKILDNLEKISKKKNKKKCFIISNTSKKFNKSFYLTPIRESKKAFYCGAVVFENKISEEIAKKIDGRVDYVYVDLEKKISNKKDKLVNTERSVKENIKYSIIKNYKSNDITVNSTETLINDYFSNDFRGIGGKKILIIGVGNIGSKIALRLVESGANVSLIRRNQRKAKTICKALNLIKPKYTKANCKIVRLKELNLSKFDVVIGCSNSEFKIYRKKIKFNKHQIVIDVGKGVFTKGIVTALNKINKPIFRIDIESMLSSFIDSTIKTEFFLQGNFIKKYKNFNLVKKGILGKKGDIVVDNVDKPKKIIGICNNDGSLLNTNYKKINFLKSKILNYEE